MKKILSIDGGGIRGIIPALVLARIEELTHRPVAELFDLIIGTSTGGILTLGLGSGKSAKELSELYEKRGRDIFQRSFWDGLTAGALDNVYDADGLEQVLQEYFGETRFSDLPKSCKAVVTTYDIRLRSPLFLKSWHPQQQAVRLREAARATSAAPTYFDPLRLKVGGLDRVLVDGGVFINNPSVSGYAEAILEFGAEDLFMLSLGTGELTRTIPYEQVAGKGKIAWLLPLLSCMFDGVADAADYQMRQILKQEGAYFRLQVSLGKADDPLRANDDMDDATGANILALKEIAENLIREREGDLGKICDALLA